jgi:two-component system sensor histidine kinase UhpB
MKHPAFKIALAYIVVSALWIIISDRVLDALVSDPVPLSYLQTIKGWFFVFFTGWLLYLMISRYAGERERFAQTLLESQERLQMVANATNDVVWDWNLKTNALWWNQNYFSLFGYRPEDMRDNLSDWSDRVHPEEKDRILAGIEEVLSSGANVWSDEYRYLRADGTTAYIFDRGFVLRDAAGQAYRMVGSMQDITHRKETEEQILHSQAELRRLTAYVESAREEERTRIAREIHDELGQAMTALKMDVSWLERKAIADPSTLTEKTQEMIQLIDETIRTIRRIATELRPGVLDNLGIQAAIEWQAQEFEHHTGIHCTLSFEPSAITLDDLRSTALFRILQETLTNVARHAHATAVHIALEEDHGDVSLQVRDNGKGISSEDLAILNSFGIIGIRERVSHLGGRVNFSGTPGKGTIVRVTLPLERSHENGSKHPHR